MKNPRVELLELEQVVSMWPQIAPLIDSVPAPGGIGGAFAADSEYIRTTAVYGVSRVFAFFDGDSLAMVLVAEINTTAGEKVATLLAVAGRQLSRFKALFWADILDWFRSVGVRRVEAFAEPRLAKIYLQKFGFTDTCSYVRMAL